MIYLAIHIWIENLAKELKETDYPVATGIQDALRMRRTTESVNKSFSMHGILRALDVPCSDPDYRKAEAQVYRDIFEDLLQWDIVFIELLADADRPVTKHQPGFQTGENLGKDLVTVETSRQRVHSAVAPHISRPFRNHWE
ncbi:hypothetical protein F4677DRAFT_411355 [Hypoxylon crocopeplum]|nr:hypothetical protein F4677DRAFT_411355 [Hypoxylon crocopeplum]